MKAFFIIATILSSVIAKIDLCDIYVQNSYEHYQKADYYVGKKDYKNACQELKLMNSTLLDAKFKCKMKEVDNLLEYSEDMLKKACKGK